MKIFIKARLLKLRPFILACLSLFFLSEKSYGQEPFNPCCQNQFVASVEFLEWKAMHDPIFVARRSLRPIPAAGFVPRDELYLTGRYRPGFRATIGYSSPCRFVNLSYLYFRSTDKDSVDIDGFNKLQIAGSPPNSATDTDVSGKGKARFFYQNVDGQLGYTFYPSCCLPLSF